MKAGKKLLALLLTVCMLLCMLPTVAFASGSDYLKIAMLDSGRKYFSADWVKAFLYEAKADGYTHVMLAVGNDGMRFLLDDMSLTVGGKTYSSNAVASAIRAGNNAYTTASSGEWTESEMDEFFATAKKAGIEIIPLRLHLRAQLRKVRAEADELRLAAGAERAARGEIADGLEQVRLAVGVPADEEIHAGDELRLRILVIPEAAQAEAVNLHARRGRSRSRRQTARRRRGGAFCRAWCTARR